jgi:hypothetical protein
MSGTSLIVSGTFVTTGDKGDITVSNFGSTWTIDNSAVTYAKIQNVSTTDRLLGRSSAGAGVIEEITCTSAARSILDDATTADIRTTLGLGALATQGDGDKGDITVSATGATWTIDNDVVTYAKMQNISAASRILGRGSASGAGDTEEITVGAGLQMSGTSLIVSGLFVTNGDKGDITVSNFGNTWTVDNDAITYAKIQNVSAASRILGRGSAGGAGDTEEITVGAGLQMSGTSLIVSGTFVTVGDKGDISVTNFGNTWTIDANTVTYSKIQQTSAAARLLGRRSGALGGDVEELTVGTGLQISGTVLISTVSGGGSVSDGDKGDITVSGTGATWTIDNDVVTYAKIQNISAASRILGRGSAAGSGDTQELTIGSNLAISGTVLISTINTSTFQPASTVLSDFVTLTGSSAAGYIIYHDGSTWQSLAPGATDEVLTIDANGMPVWAAK